jgi:hypothetical protein
MRSISASCVGRIAAHHSTEPGEALDLQHLADLEHRPDVLHVGREDHDADPAPHADQPLRLQQRDHLARGRQRQAQRIRQFLLRQRLSELEHPIVQCLEETLAIRVIEGSHRGPSRRRPPP